MELDLAVAGLVGTPQRDIAAQFLDRAYAPDELEILENEPAGSERLRLAHDNLRELGADLTAAMNASHRDDWAAVLQAVRLIHGRAAITRVRQ